MGQRLPELDVVKRRLVDVEADVTCREAGRNPDKVLVERVVRVLYPVQVRQSDAGQVDLVRLVHRHGDAARQIYLHLVEVWRSVVVVLVAGKYQPLADPVFIEQERPAPDRIVRPRPSAALDVVTLQGERRRVRELGQEIGLRGVDTEPERLVVEHLDAGR